MEGVKCLLLEGCPSPWLVLSSEEVEGGDDMGEIGNEFVIEIGKSKERKNAFDKGRRFPVSLTGSMVTCSSPIIMPKNSILGASKRHLKSFRDRPCSHRRRRT